MPAEVTQPRFNNFKATARTPRENHLRRL